MKRVLMIAYHFPPLAGSSGIQRTLRFVQHLPGMGWEPMVLSTSPRAYERTSDDLLSEVPPGILVHRAFALDTARHLQVAGRYLNCMAQPDRWMSWKFAGARAGRRLIARYQPSVIWSTYPIATAHVLAAALHRSSGIPWVADFRDPMAQIDYPENARTRQSFLDIEHEASVHARYCVFTTPGAAKDFRDRYPGARERIVLLENGYDEESFASIEIPESPVPSDRSAPLLMLHSGIVYPSERDPTQLFQALGILKSSGRLTPADVRIRFRASVHEEVLHQLAKVHGAEEFVELCPAIGYRDALAEMMQADTLLVMQASNCNAQIPAKIYEYLRAGKPILGLTDSEGDTADVLRRAGLFDVARLDSVEEISRALLDMVFRWRRGEDKLPNPAAVRGASRRNRSRVLAGLFDDIAGEP